MNQKWILILIFLSGITACSSTPPMRDSERGERASPGEATQGLDEDEDAPASGTGLPTYSAAKTRYNSVSESFDSARLMPSLSDFDLLDEPHPKTSCFSTKATDPNLMSEIVIRQMMVSYEGTPDYGPLFPGSSDRVEQRLVIGKNNGWVNSQNLTNDKRQVFELNHSGNSMIISIIENKFGIYQDIGAPAEVWLRKDSRGFIFFKVFRVDAEHKRTEVFVGYCFKK